MKRRTFSRLALGSLGAAPLGAAPMAASGRKRVAGVVTEYTWYSHADVVLGRILGGNSANNVHSEPRTHLVSLYRDQKPKNDMAPDMAARFGFTLYPTIHDALTLGGGKLAVDAVILIGEHGNYPRNELGQQMYPRYELFNQILDVYEKSGRAVPTFSDKHFSYSWEKASKMYDRARRLRVPFMAGSSIPVSVRTPLLEIPLNAPLEHAVALGYGPPDAYGFHLLESLQCMVERRAGGETGIESVEWLEGDAIWKWIAGEGAWSKPLIDEAARRNPSRKPVPVEEEARKPVLFLLNYRDGFRAAAMIITPSGARWSFACRRKGESRIDSTLFGLAAPGRPLPHFDGLVKCIEDMFVSGKPVYPVERTLLTTGALAFLFQSKGHGRRMETPELSVRYQAPEHAYFQKS